MKRERYMLALITALVCTVIIFVAILLSSAGLADNETTLPTPEYTPTEEIILLRGEAPKQLASGLNTYETFDEALERTKAAVPDELAELAGRLIWGEGGGVQNDANRYATLWTAINRADAWGGTLEERITEAHAFHGLATPGTVPEQHVNEAREIIALWQLEKDGWIIPDTFPAGLPVRFLYFEGDGRVNHFSTKYGGGEYWDGVESRWGNG